VRSGVESWAKGQRRATRALWERYPP
jgi:hypothetical protein